jgi:hypothetical protein
MSIASLEACLDKIKKAQAKMAAYDEDPSTAELFETEEFLDVVGVNVEAMISIVLEMKHQLDHLDYLLDKLGKN